MEAILWLLEIWLKVPKHLRPSQEFVLDIYKKELEALIQELIKIEAADFIDK